MGSTRRTCRVVLCRVETRRDKWNLGLCYSQNTVIFPPPCRRRPCSTARRHASVYRFHVTIVAIVRHENRFIVLKVPLNPNQSIYSTDVDTDVGLYSNSVMHDNAFWYSPGSRASVHTAHSRAMHTGGVYTGWPKKSATTKLSKHCVKSYLSLPMRLDLFVKLKKWSSTIIVSVCIKYSLYDLLFEVNNYDRPTK